MIIIAAALSIAINVPELDKLSQLAPSVTWADRIKHECIDTTGNAYSLGVVGLDVRIDAKTGVLLTTQKGEKPAFDNRIIVTLHEVTLEKTVNSMILDLLYTRISNCMVQIGFVRPWTKEEDVSQRAREITDAFVGFRVETAPGVFQWIRFDGKKGVLVPAPTAPGSRGK